MSKMSKVLGWTLGLSLVGGGAAWLFWPEQLEPTPAEKAASQPAPVAEQVKPPTAAEQEKIYVSAQKKRVEVYKAVKADAKARWVKLVEKYLQILHAPTVCRRLQVAQVLFDPRIDPLLVADLAKIDELGQKLVANPLAGPRAEMLAAVSVLESHMGPAASDPGRFFHDWLVEVTGDFERVATNRNTGRKLGKFGLAYATFEYVPEMPETATIEQRMAFCPPYKPRVEQAKTVLETDGAVDFLEALLTGKTLETPSPQLARCPKPDQKWTFSSFWRLVLARNAGGGDMRHFDKTVADMVRVAQLITEKMTAFNQTYGVHPWEAFVALQELKPSLIRDWCKVADRKK